MITGDGANLIHNASPKFGRYLANHRYTVEVKLVEAFPENPNGAAFTTYYGENKAKVWIATKPPLWSSAETKTVPIHEAIHVAYNFKGLGGYPPRQHLLTLYWAAKRYASLHPDTAINLVTDPYTGPFSLRSMGETVVEWMANMVYAAQAKKESLT